MGIPVTGKPCSAWVGEWHGVGVVVNIPEYSLRAHMKLSCALTVLHNPPYRQKIVIEKDFFPIPQSGLNCQLTQVGISNEYSFLNDFF